MAKFEIKDGVAIIPDGAVEIGEDTFYDCSALTAIYVPAKTTDYYKEFLSEKLHGKIVEL